jgi:hypothetical protein
VVFFVVFTAMSINDDDDDDDDDDVEGMMSRL